MEPTIETKFESREEKANVLKIVLVGDTQVGKTSLIKALTGTGLVGRGYSVSLDLTIQPEKKSEDVPIIGRIYDLRSQRYFPYLHSLYYHGAKGAIIIFDVTNKESFNSVSKWRDIVWGHAGNIPLLLCGSKSDLRRDNMEQITIEEAKTLAKNLSKKQKQKIPYVELSAEKNIIAYCDAEVESNDSMDIYPTTDAFRKPFVNWLIEIVKKR